MFIQNITKGYMLTMFIFKMIRKNIIKHWKKSLLSIVISAMLVLFLSLYIQNMVSNKTQLQRLGEITPVTGRVCNIDGSREVGLQIEFEDLLKIKDTGLITDDVITTQTYVDLANISQEGKSHRPEFSYIGINAFSFLTAFSSKDVTYIENYNESFLGGKDAVCILRDRFMEDQKLELGDELTIAVYAPEYDGSGAETFKYISLGNVTLKVIGSYYNSYRGPADNLPSIISPLEFITDIYQGTDVTCYASSARFTLKDPLKMNEFKTKMLEIGFKSVDMLKGFSRVGKAITMNDETFIMSATQLKKSLNLLQGLAPMIFILVTVIGFIASYLLMQSRQYEFAIMRSLGTGRRRSFLILLLESAVLSFFGSSVGTFVGTFITKMEPMTMLLILAEFLTFYLLGTVITLTILNRFSVMAILSKTD
ncbi:MAG: transporter permease [Herbinix sp.]|jgi:ABC-type lipoprotein release transport system permease subunit|nr:transporter permease [Herbinix sp.]